MNDMNIIKDFWVNKNIGNYWKKDAHVYFMENNYKIISMTSYSFTKVPRKTKLFIVNFTSNDLLSFLNFQQDKYLCLDRTLTRVNL